MREILFRGKRVDNKEWVYGTVEFHLVDGDLTKTEQKAFITYDSMDNIGKVYRDTYEVDLETVGQFAGLTDNNGNKIFEGDVCRCYGGEHIYGFWEYDQNNLVDNITNPFIMMDLNEIDFTEVLGNTYDNPELVNM